MSISCIIIEDQPPAQRILQTYIRDLAMLDLKGTFDDALSALKFLQSNPVDLLFLDIHLPKLSGIDFLNILHAKPKVIFTTAFSDYALQGYELNIVDYLLKPFSFERFVRAVTKVLASQTAVSPSQNVSTIPPYLFVKSGHEHLKIDVWNIHYIKAEGDYTMVFLEESKHLISHPLKFWTQYLPATHFCQIHKSYLVNICFVKKFSGNQVFLDDVQLPIGRTYKSCFLGLFAGL